MAARLWWRRREGRRRGWGEEGKRGGHREGQAGKERDGGWEHERLACRPAGQESSQPGVEGDAAVAGESERERPGCQKGV